jgi:DNA-directed RNA polymerase beta' subunit
MISESGAVMDINELAAALELTPEAAEEINALSLEQIFDEVDKFVVDQGLSDEDAVVLEPALESLRNVYHSVRDSGHISRADAQVLMQMTTSLENFRDPFDTMPANSFTELPSKVNYTPAMEGILSSILRKIWEAIKAFAAKIKGYYSGSAIMETRSAAMEQKVEQELSKRVIKVDFKKVEKVTALPQVDAKVWKDVNAFFDTAIKDNRLVSVVYAYEPFLNTALQNMDGALAALFDANSKVAAMFSVEFGPTEPSWDQWNIAVRQMLDIIKHFNTMKATPVKYSISDMPTVLRSIDTATQQTKKFGVLRIFALWKKVWAKFNAEQREYNQQYRDAEEAGNEEKANQLLDFISSRYSISHALANFNTIRNLMASVKLDMARLVDGVETQVDELLAA